MMGYKIKIAQYKIKAMTKLGIKREKYL